MSTTTSIEWTDATWNPTTGCTKVSPGCAHCYIERTPAFRIAGRRFVDGATDLQLHADRLEQPLRWRQPRRVFVNSLSDLFHHDVPDEFIDRVFAVMAATPRHSYQVLTKRAPRMRAYVKSRQPPHFAVRMHAILDNASNEGATPEFAWPLPNVWLGVSVENQHFADERIPLLLQTPAAVRFISAEPLLGPVDIGLSSATCKCCGRIWSSRWLNVHRPLMADFPMAMLDNLRGVVVPAGVSRAASNRHGALAVNGIGIRPGEAEALPGLDWVIVGGESGSGARQFDLAWPRSIVQQCKAAGVPVFVKQLGAVPVSEHGSTDIPQRSSVSRTDRPMIGFRNRKGGDPSEWPEDLRVREFPHQVPA